MLSILIPTYNDSCLELVSQLRTQIDKAAPIACEILVADDGSTDLEMKKRNSEIARWPGCRFIALEKNSGRAAVRNLLAQEARYPWLLFLDRDVAPADPHFVVRYIQSIHDRAEVIVGGVIASKCPPAAYGELRWRYDKMTGRRQNVMFRQKNPYRYFTTQNFLINRETFLSIRFDEQITQYGYEDMKFGIELEKRHIPVIHIDNAVIHLGIDANRDFVEKSETALRTLFSLDMEVKEHATVAIVAQRLERWRLKPLMVFWHQCFSGLEKKNLLSHHPILFLFQLYKLGYYCNLK